MKAFFLRAIVIVFMIFGLNSLTQAQATFSANPFIAIIIFTPDGDICAARVLDPIDDINDFIRVNPNGETFSHIAEHSASIVVFTKEGGIFTGTGSLTSDFHLGKNQEDNVLITGQVSDGVGTYQAVCRDIQNANHVSTVSEIDLH
jgi:hypothetical protein